MSAGSKYQYYWADGVKVRTPTPVSAPDYIDLMMSWIESQLNDEQLFPLQFGTPLPKNFLQISKTIFKRIFRVYAHMYYSHYVQIQNLELEAHFNTCFKHFILFVEEFEMIEDKELAPLEDVIAKIANKQSTDSKKGNNKKKNRSSSFHQSNIFASQEDESHDHEAERKTIT